MHIGFAVDTEAGLIVPVIRDANAKGVWELAEEIERLSAAAREGRLKPDEIQGGCFTVSRLHPRRQRTGSGHTGGSPPGDQGGLDR